CKGNIFYLYPHLFATVPLIPEVVARGEKTVKGNSVVYKLRKGGDEFTVLTDNKNGREEFCDFYSNRKGGRTSPSNTQLSARDYDASTNVAAKMAKSSESAKVSGENFEVDSRNADETAGGKAVLRMGDVPGSVMTEAERRRAAEEAAALRKAEEERKRAEREEAERIEREALNGVPDMVDDTPQDARARGYRRVSGHKVDRQGPVQGLRGKEVAVKFSDDAIANGRVAVIEAEQLQPSHIQGVRNPVHFIDEAQPKERNDEASVLSARKIAGNIRPEEITSSVTAYTGAPTVNARGEVIQGNSRSDALRQMWEGHQEQADKYKQYLMDHAEEFGLNADDIAGMQHPVLVNMLDVEDADAITLGQFVAQDTESGGVERIKPKNALRKMGANIRSFANLLLRSNDEETSFAGLVDKNGADVLEWMSQKGYITPTQYQSAFDSKGNITAEAKNDLRGVLYQSVFKGGGTRLEEMFNEMPAKAQKAILATAFRDYDSPNSERMIGEIQNSIRAYHALSQNAEFANAKTFKDARSAAELWKIQYQLDDATGESYLPAENFSNFALLLATMYKGEKQSVIQGTFNKLYDLVQGAHEASLFEQADNTPRTLAQAIYETLNIRYDVQRRIDVLAGDTATSQRGQQGSTGNAATGERVENGKRTADGGGGIESDSRQGKTSETYSVSQEKEIDLLDPRTMSEEEKQRRGDMLRNAPAIDVKKEVITSTPELSARQSAEKWWDENVGKIVSYDTEIGEVEINKNSIKNSLAHRYGQKKLDAITSLVDGFENAVYLGTMPDFTRQEGVVNHYFAYPIMYDGELNYVFCRAMQDSNKNTLYVHEVFVEKKTKKGDTLQTAAFQPHGGIALYKDILTNVLEASADKGSKNNQSDNESGEKNVQSVRERVETDDAAGQVGGVREQKAGGAEASSASAKERSLLDGLVSVMRKAGIDVVTDAAEGQRVLDEENARTRKSKAKKRALETVSSSRDERYQQTVVSSADGANTEAATIAGAKSTNNATVTPGHKDATNVVNNLESVAIYYRKSSNKTRGFITDLSIALGLRQNGASKYGSFVLPNGHTLTIRVSNHNSKVSNFDSNDELNGISIVISTHRNKGIENDGKAHVVEYFYSKKDLERSSGKPLADIALSVKEALSTGEFKDTTGLAERQEVNVDGDNMENPVDGMRFFRTKDGEAYGFTVNGKIYLDPRIATAETAVHEYAHLWGDMLRRVNPKEWRNVVRLMKGTPVWDEVRRTYPELRTEDEIADEVLAQYSGRRGAERLRAEREAAMGEADGVMGKAAMADAFERVRKALREFWRKVCDLLNVRFTSAEDVADRVLADLLNGVNPVDGRDGGMRNRMRMQEDEEIKDIVAKAKADGTYMKAPNGQPSRLSPRQWAQVRTMAFKKWFGDWEKAARVWKLLRSEPVVKKGDEYAGRYELNSRSAEEYVIRSLRGAYTNRDTGNVINVTRASRKVVHHDAENDVHLMSIAYIPDMIENAVFIEERPNEKGSKFDFYRYYVVGLKIGGVDYTAKLVVGQKNGESFYDHSLTQMEKSSLIDLTDGVKADVSGNETAVSAGKDKRLVSILQTDASKVVDENGEPLVVYHGTQEEFSVFENYVAANMYGETFSDGYMFSDESSASNYGEPMALFLNIRNLDDYRDKGKLLDVVERYFDDFNNQTDEFYFESVEDAVSAFSEIIAEDGRLYHDEGSIELNQAEAMWHVLQNKLKTLAEESGFDGFVINDSTRGDEHVSYCAFSPTQIKSATDNVGTFDGTNPDIRYQFVGEKGAAAADKAEDGSGVYRSKDGG
ncbi:MAG: hypothetical protein ACI36X_00140, partial [Bacteroidaceae bacterium]